jgi:hypothetical protein
VEVEGMSPATLAFDHNGPHVAFCFAQEIDGICFVCFFETSLN